MKVINRSSRRVRDNLCRLLMCVQALMAVLGGRGIAAPPEPLTISGTPAASQVVIRADQSRARAVRAAQPTSPPAPENLPSPADQLRRDERAWLTEDQRPIGSLSLNITNSAGEMPTTFSRPNESAPPLDGRADFIGPTGGIRPVRADLCHNPLYFEERRVERTGQSVPCGQTVVSGVHFFGNAVLLPAKMVVHPPRSIVCQDRYFRRNEYLQEHPAAAGATGFLQSSFWTGMFLLP